MKFIVSSSVLLKNLQHINSVVASDPIVSILERFLFRIGDGKLNIQVDDSKPVLGL